MSKCPRQNVVIRLLQRKSETRPGEDEKQEPTRKKVKHILSMVALINNSQLKAAESLAPNDKVSDVPLERPQP
jgi:hypothetical protein